MVLSKISVNSFLNSLQTDNLRPSSHVGQLVAVAMVWVHVFVFGDGKQFQENVYYQWERSDQDAYSPLLNSQSKVGINSKCHPSESDKQYLETNNGSNDD